ACSGRASPRSRASSASTCSTSTSSWSYAAATPTSGSRACARTSAGARHATRTTRACWPSVAALVLERDPEPHAVAGDRAVLDRHVLAQDLRDPQVPDALARRFDRAASGRLPRLGAHTDDLGDPVDAVGHSGSPSDRLTLRRNSFTPRHIANTRRCGNDDVPRSAHSG